jgi:hypothetical protein
MCTNILNITLYKSKSIFLIIWNIQNQIMVIIFSDTCYCDHTQNVNVSFVIKYTCIAFFLDSLILHGLTLCAMI